jgi:hypothetical protein
VVYWKRIVHALYISGTWIPTIVSLIPIRNACLEKNGSVRDCHSSPYDQIVEYRATTWPEDNAVTKKTMKFRHIFYTDGQLQPAFSNGTPVFDCSATTNQNKLNTTEIVPIPTI